MSCKRAYLVGKGSSLEVVKAEWFNADSPVWCINQSATVIRQLLPDREVHCVQNDPWIKYVPPQDVIWHLSDLIPANGHPKAVRFYREQVSDKWESPTCMNALQLLHDDGYDQVTMIGFDSHFDKSSTEYAKSLHIRSEGKTNYYSYDTGMRRLAKRLGMELVWIDKDGAPHDEDFKFTKCLVAVAMGEKYTRQTEGMIRSFLAHNPDWSVERYYDNDLCNLLPDSCKGWTSFNKCEIGRWYAMQKCLETYDTALYCDGDIRWYDSYEEHDHALVITPHCITKLGSMEMRHNILKDGMANIGILETNRTPNVEVLFDYVIGEVMHNPKAFMHKDQLWLQNLVSTCPWIFDCVWNQDFTVNVASWNLRRYDRMVFQNENGEFMVKCNGHIGRIKSFHFSSKSIYMLHAFGNACIKLLEEYRNER